MQTSIRELKAQLSQIIRRVEAGDTVTVTSHNKPVAEIVPLRKKRSIHQLVTEPGIHWNGEKPKGIARPESPLKSISVSAWVSEDRR
jgi:prevent-host-death family protein